MVSPFDLTGSLALVTGASRGIGAGIALALAEAGADVIGTARTQDSLSVTTEAVRDAGGVFIPLEADLSTASGARDLAKRASAIGNVGILVNNAGIAHRAPVETHSDAMWDEVVAVNLSSPFILARELGVGMLERGDGKIIFIASMMSYQGGRNVASYAATKTGVTGIVHALANEWGDRGVTVNALAPGYIETDLTSGAHSDAERRHAFQERIPMGRWGTPADLGGAAVFLSSPASSYVTGIVIPVDGGWLVR
jgi:2-deoxy-D-gluconate 3-dehydrogenase